MNDVAEAGGSASSGQLCSRCERFERRPGQRWCLRLTLARGKKAVPGGCRNSLVPLLLSPNRGKSFSGSGTARRPAVARRPFYSMNPSVRNLFMMADAPSVLA